VTEKANTASVLKNNIEYVLHGHRMDQKRLKKQITIKGEQK